VTDTADTRSSAALQFNNCGFYTVSSAIPTDNVGIEMWVRTSNTSQNNFNIFKTRGYVEPHLKFGMSSGNWAATIGASTWVGGTSGSGQPITSGEWTHIAVIRENGTSTFYFNGEPKAGTPTTAFVSGTDIHLGITGQDGASRFDGDIDQVRVFTFVPGTVDPVRALLINHVNEPPDMGTMIAIK